MDKTKLFRGCHDLACSQDLVVRGILTGTLTRIFIRPQGGGVVQVGTVSTLRQETFFRNKEYTIEIENFRGRNLRR